jgi:hypothetical protein
MPTSARLTATQIETLLLQLLQGLGCTGQCIYEWNGTNYELQPGSSCTGTECNPCPATMDGLFRDLVLLLPEVFPDSNTVTASCMIVDLEESVLKALKKLVIESRKGAAAKKSKLAAPAKKAPKKSAAVKKAVKSAPPKKSKPAKRR